MITGMKQLKRTMKAMPREVKNEVRLAVGKNLTEGVKIAKVLAPDVTGETKAGIFAKFDIDGLGGSIEAAQDDKASQIEVKAKEFGRKNGDRGTTTPQPFIRPTQEYLGKRFRGRIARAINKGMKAASGG